MKRMIALLSATLERVRQAKLAEQGNKQTTPSTVDETTPKHRDEIAARLGMS